MVAATPAAERRVVSVLFADLVGFTPFAERRFSRLFSASVPSPPTFGACSSGSACKTGDPEPSEVLTALGLTRDWALGSLRVTLGSPGEVSDALPGMLERNRSLWEKQSGDFLADSGSSSSEQLQAIDQAEIMEEGLVTAGSLGY